VIKRHDKLGIKQTIQKQWMDSVVKMMLAGLSEREIRDELNSYLAAEKPFKGTKPDTHRFIIQILASWFAPEKELILFRDHALELIRNKNPQHWLSYHWAVISASYPFWFNVAKQIGRLLKLQDQITQAQIFSRLKEQYGDRETVVRNTRYTIRSFVAWGILADANVKGCYEQSETMIISDPNLLILLYESALHTDKEGRATLGILKNNPAFFPFQMPVLTGDFISQQRNTIDVVRYGLDEELLKLRTE